MLVEIRITNELACASLGKVEIAPRHAEITEHITWRRRGFQANMTDHADGREYPATSAATDVILNPVLNRTSSVRMWLWTVVVTSTVPTRSIMP